jgi:hypothetical protein
LQSGTNPKLRDMTHPARTTLALAILLGCTIPLEGQQRTPTCGSPCDGLRGPVPMVRTHTPALREPTGVPSFDRVIDPVAARLGLARLRDAPLPDGVREIRLWSGFGLGGHRLLLVHDGPQGVTGRIAFWWRPGQVSGKTKWELAAAGCSLTRSSPTLESCELETQIDWADLLRRIDALDPWGLPAPPPRIGIDGYSLVVETRIGVEYRTYTHRGGQQDYAEASRGEALLRLQTS